MQFTSYLIPCTLLLGMVSQTSGQEILILGLGGDLHSVDINSGETSLIGNTGLSHLSWTGMARNSQGEIYAAFGDFLTPYTIYEINPVNAQATFVAQTDLFGLSALAFDPSGRLFALNDRTAPQSGRPMDLYSIDLATGGTSLIGDTGLRNTLTLDFYGGWLWCYNLGNGLHRINPTTGIATDVNPQFRGPIGSTSSLCINSEGTTYYIDGGLWMVDKETGSCSLVDFLSVSGFWGEAVFVDGPTPPQSLWIVGQAAGPAGAKITGVTPGGPVALLWSDGPTGTTVLPVGFPCAGIALSLSPVIRLGAVISANSVGEFELGPKFLPASARGNIRLQALDLSSCKTTNSVLIAF